MRAEAARGPGGVSIPERHPPNGQARTTADSLINWNLSWPSTAFGRHDPVHCKASFNVKPPSNTDSCARAAFSPKVNRSHDRGLRQAQ